MLDLEQNDEDVPIWYHLVVHASCADDDLHNECPPLHTKTRLTYSKNIIYERNSPGSVLT